jgi:hypothetical protein
MRRREIQKHLPGLFFRKVAYTSYDVFWFVKWMDFVEITDNSLTANLEILN